MNPWVIAGIAVLCLLSGLSGRAIRGRRARIEIDQAYDLGWRDRWHREDNEARKHLAAGFVLRPGADGRPVWVLEGVRRVAAAAGRSKLPDDRQVRAELAAIADDPDPRGFERCPRCGCDADEGDCGGCYCHETYQAPAPLNPPGRAGQEPPGPVMVPGEMPATQAAPPCRDQPPAAGPTGNNGETASPGGSLFAMLDDDGFFEVARWELKRLARMASEPFALTAWGAVA